MNKSNGKVVTKVTLSVLVVLAMAALAFVSPRLVYAATHQDATPTETTEVVSNNSQPDAETSTKDVATETVNSRDATEQDNLNESQEVSEQDDLNETQEENSQINQNTQGNENQTSVETPEVETPEAVSSSTD